MFGPGVRLAWKHGRLPGLEHLVGWPRSAKTLRGRDLHYLSLNGPWLEENFTLLMV